MKKVCDICRREFEADDSLIENGSLNSAVCPDCIEDSKGIYD